MRGMGRGRMGGVMGGRNIMRRRGFFMVWEMFKD